MGAEVTPKSKPRRKRVPPGTRIRLDTASHTEVLASLQFASDYNHCKGTLDEFRRQWEADGKDPFEPLAHVTAHNWAAAEAIRRLKADGAAKVKAKAKRRHAKIAQDLKKAGGRVKSVVLDAEARKRRPKGRSERTVRRRVQTAPDGSQAKRPDNGSTTRIPA